MLDGQWSAALRACKHLPGSTPFTKQNVHVLTTVVPALTSNLSRIVNKQKLDAVDLKLSLLNEFHTVLQTTRHPNDLCQSIVDIVQRTTNCEECCLFTWEDDTLQVCPNNMMTAHYLQNVVHSPAGYAFNMVDILNVDDVHQDDRFSSWQRTVDGLIGKRTRSVKCIPVANADGTTLAVLQITCYTSPHAFTDGQLDALKDFLQIQCQFLYKQKGGLTKVETWVRDISTYTLDDAIAIAEACSEQDFLTVLFQQATRLTSADRCMLFTPSSGGKIFNVAFGNASGGISFCESDIQCGIENISLTSRETVKVNKAYDDPRFFANVDNKTGYLTQSALSIPICTGTQALAVFQVLNKKDSTQTTLPFTAEDESRLMAMLKSVASLGRPWLGVEAVRLRSPISEGRCRSCMEVVNGHLSPVPTDGGTGSPQTSILDSTESMFNATTIEEIWHALTEGAMQLTGADRCMVFMPTVDKQWAKPKNFSVAVRSTEGMVTTETLVSSGVESICFMTGQVIRLDNAYSDPRFSTELDDTYRFPYRAFIHSPRHCPSSQHIHFEARCGRHSN